ncbi:hypothetical protein F2Q70_00010548 [Brassica cretica]|uniref:Replication protein A 70 kDa DNA-binding subunit B/D first OB fold domain-containing protein n=1 Tax=Brassica cretica TaxID=69181 RepID=A0A8S9LY83_BRACR|nr:hypothetical protein F2Q70_00010548 [Brassica cretica]
MECFGESASYVDFIQSPFCCKQELLQRVERQCGVGEWKVITNFTLRPASGLIRPTNHVYKMEFMNQTSITDGNLTCDNMFLHLHDFDNIKNGSCDERFLIDVIGEVLDFGGQNIVQFERKEVTKVEFNLRDINNQRMQCCIAGKSAEIFTQKVKQSNSGDICLIRFARVVNYKGEWKVTNAFDSSLVLINPDIKEAKALNQKFHGDDNTLEMSQHINEKIVIHEKRQKWSQYPFRTIQERVEITELFVRFMLLIPLMDGIIMLVMSAKIRFSNQLFYLLNQRCQAGGVNFVSVMLQRYKLNLLVQDQTGESKFTLLDSVVLVQDQTGESKFTLLDSVATSIVKISAAKVVKGLLDKVEVQEMLPTEIVDIVSKSYGYGISVDENNNSSGLEKINAMKVWGLKDILWKRIKSLHQNSTTSRK